MYRKMASLVLIAVLVGLAGSGFAAEQFIDPANITATASSINYQLEAIYSCNGNGLTADLHTNNIGGEPPGPGEGTMWLAEGTDPQAWIQYEFDKAYSLKTMWVWNYNQITGSGGDKTGRAIKDCTIEYSPDGTSWTQLGDTHTFAKADGSDSYAHNTEIDFGSVKAKFIKITTISDHGGGYPGLSEVRFYAGDNVGFETEASGALETVTPAQISVVLTSAQAEVVSVNYAVTGGTAAAGADYAAPAPGTLVFDPGETSKTISIDIIDDGVDEEDETIELTLSNVTGGDVELGTAQHVYSIIDPRPAVGFDSDSGSGPENPQIIHRPRKIAVSLSAAAAGVVTVDYAAVGGTASRGSDYTMVDGMLTFGAGEVTKYIAVTLIDDEAEESDETIVLTLSNPNGAKFGAYTEHTYTILDDDTGAEPANRDLNNDGVVDFGDLAVFLESWLECTLDPPELCWE